MTPSSPRLTPTDPTDREAPPMARTPAMTALAKAARKYAKAQEQRNAALAELQHAIRVAAAEGDNTKNAIIEVAGVGRQTVFDALKTPGPTVMHEYR